MQQPMHYPGMGNLPPGKFHFKRVIIILGCNYSFFFLSWLAVSLLAVSLLAALGAAVRSERYFGANSGLFCCILVLVFWPAALIVPCFPCDQKNIVVMPDGEQKINLNNVFFPSTNHDQVH
jgi:hypothetical protein